MPPYTRFHQTAIFVGKKRLLRRASLVSDQQRVSRQLVTGHWLTRRDKNEMAKHPDLGDKGVCSFQAQFQ